MSPRVLSPLVALLLAGPVLAGNLDRALLSRAGQVLEHLNTTPVNTVGVLPFRVQIGKRPAGTHSPLAVQLPGRLENALIVVQGNESGSIRVIRSPEGKQGPWRTSRKAFAALFLDKHTPAWGPGRVKADAFLTGEVSWNAESKSAQVTIERIDAHS